MLAQDQPHQFRQHLQVETMPVRQYHRLLPRQKSFAAIGLAGRGGEFEPRPADLAGVVWGARKRHCCHAPAPSPPSFSPAESLPGKGGCRTNCPPPPLWAVGCGHSALAPGSLLPGCCSVRFRPAGHPPAPPTNCPRGFTRLTRNTYAHSAPVHLSAFSVSRDLPASPLPVVR